MIVWVNFCRSDHAFATGNEVDQYQDDGDDEQDVNEAADGGTGYEAEQPKNQKDDGDSV
jgi:hypothetical protein